MDLCALKQSPAPLLPLQADLTFTGNPLGCAAALESLDLLESPHTTARIAALEAGHAARLAPLAARCGRLVHPRQCGTIAAVDWSDGSGYGAAIGPTLKRFFLERGLLLRPLGSVLYLLPPYCLSEDQLDRAYQAIEAAATTLPA